MSSGLSSSRRLPTALAERMYSHAELLHAPDVGAVVDLAGQDAVPARVARQEGDRHAADLAEEVRVARRAERGVDLHLAGVLEQLVEARPSDHAHLGSSGLAQ